MMHTKKFILFSIAAICFLSHCSEPSQTVSRVERDRSVTPENSFSEVFFDSSLLDKFIATENLPDTLAHRIKNFYNGRNYEYAWFFKNGVADYAKGFLDLVNDYIHYSGDSALYNHRLDQLMDSVINEPRPPDFADTNIVKTELLLTRHFFRYASRAYQGRNQLNMKELEWFIPRKKIDLVALLDSVIKNKGRNASRFEPVNRQYKLLRNYLAQYYDIQKKGGWAEVSADAKSLKPGDSSGMVRAIKNRLILTGEFAEGDTTAVFTPALGEALKRFQRHYGLSGNGRLSAAVINEMNRPVDYRIQQLLINMERMRWVPAEPATDFLLVNIPEFRLHVYEKGKYAWNMNIVVGTQAHNTVIFTGTLKYVVFSPYWNVPPGILKNEIIPAIRRNPNYLARHNMEWNGNTVRQKPGLNNSLGLVKFLFPNQYNIYLHDTPSKSLFAEDKRAFSHGCIRLAEPAKLARFILRSDEKWDSVKIEKAMKAGREQYVTVKEAIPVYIGYFTAWVDREDNLNFRQDIYGHDEKMAARLFVQR